MAVLPVVLYHAGLPGFTGGYIDVDVFFALSGFLITSIVASEMVEGRFSLLSFYERRARRILPALSMVVLSTFVAGWFFLLPDELSDFGQSAVATALLLSNVFFMMKLDYFAPAAEFAPLLHTWSLAVEEQFYLFYPPLLALLFAWRGRGLALWSIIGLSLLSLAISRMSYKYIERPFRIRPPVGYSRGTIFSASTAVLGVMILAGALLHLAKPIPGPLTPTSVVIAASQHRNPDQIRYADKCTFRGALRNPLMVSGS